MLVGRFKTYRKKGSFGSLFFGLIFFAWLQQPPRPKTQRFARRPLRYLCVVRFFTRHAAPCLVGGSWIAKMQKFAKRPLRYFCMNPIFFSRRTAPSAWLQPFLSRCKVAEVRKATTPLLLQQGSNFLIRRCKALRQTSTHQESFSLRGQNEGAEVVGRTKLADRTTFKQI